MSSIEHGDDYSDMDIFKVVEEGSIVTLNNDMSEEQVEKIEKMLLEQYGKKLEEINKLIKKIRELIVSVEPLGLLNYCSGMFKTTCINTFSEYKLSVDSLPTSRMAEYVQSILVSTKSNDNYIEDEPEKVYYEIHSKIEKLYELIYIFLLSWIAKFEKEHPDVDKDIIKSLVEEQLLFNVRGNRYQYLNNEYNKDLLLGHDQVFRELFDMSANEIIEGINKIEYCLSQAWTDKVNELTDLFDSQDDLKILEGDKRSHSLVEELFGIKLYDVLEQTGWNEKLVKELSISIGDNSDFFDRDEYPGWPIINLPIKFKPFIEIDGKYYCFDYYNFSDNIYRSLQKAVAKLEPDYKWSDIQKESSEKKVENVFKEILPGSTIYANNSYPIVGESRQYAENDLLVIYDNVLIVVEVKAGSFVYTAPIVDFEAHIRSYKSLIENPNNQCARTVEYLESKQVVELYDDDRRVKATIDMDNIEDIYMVSVTMDNINSFAAKSEKLAFLNLQCNAISIAIDDLMVYRDYFEHPTQFFHFLNQRRLATQNKKIALNDELDHLGLYIEYNQYNIAVSEIPDDYSEIVFDGFRKDLDEYFNSLSYPGLDLKKTTQNIPELFIKIMDYLEENNIPRRVQMVKYLLDFASDAKNKFCEQINHVLERQKQLKNTVIVNSLGEGDSLRYTIVVYQPGVKPIEKEEIQDYVYEKIVWNNDVDRELIILYYDDKDIFKSIECKTYTYIDVPEDQKLYFEFLGEKDAIVKIEMYVKKNKMISEDELCPCQSGKKYRDCCLNREWKHFRYHSPKLYE